MKFSKPGLGDTPFKKQTESLASALADKGTPGVILLGIIFFVVWVVPVIFSVGFFILISDFQEKSAVNIWPLVLYFSFFLILLVILLRTSYTLTINILQSIVPTMLAEVQIEKRMVKAFGGKAAVAAGSMMVEQLDPETATRRIKRVLEILVEHTARVLQVSDHGKIRINLSISKDEKSIVIADGFHVHMLSQGHRTSKELSIRIPVGHLSSGTAYKYFLPVYSRRTEVDGRPDWDHMPSIFETSNMDDRSVKKLMAAIDKEVQKANTSLKWIVSIPIPLQVRPFRIACGVLNIDGLSDEPYRDQLIPILSDVSTAAALIGVINRATDILGGKCHRQDDAPEEAKKGSLESVFSISPEEYDPSDCPQPTEDFKNALSQIKQLEFFKDISTADVTSFLREQLRS